MHLVAHGANSRWWFVINATLQRALGILPQLNKAHNLMVFLKICFLPKMKWIKTAGQ